MEIYYKIGFAAALFTMFIPVRTVSASLRRSGRGKINQMENELSTLKVIRPILGFIFYGAVLWWLISSQSVPLSFAAPDTVRFFGLLLSFAGVALLQWSVVALGTQYRGGLGLYEDHRLITTGPYAVVRHPIYIAFLIMMLGVLMLTANMLIGMSGLIFVSLIPLFRIRKEEEQLSERFAATYEDYRRKTGCLIPRF